MNEKQPRILVVSTNAWNSKNGCTWPFLLKIYDSDNVADIFARDEIPDSTVCSRYFNISENRVLKSIFNRKIKTGKEVCIQNCEVNKEDISEHNERYQKMRNKRRYSLLFARELVWKLGKWKTEELNKFIDDFNPDVVLYATTNKIFHCNIIRYVIKRTKVKAVGYIWDDTFTYKQYSDIGYKIYRFFQRRSQKKLAKLTDRFFAISDMTKKEADEFFGIDSVILTKPLYREPTVEYEDFKLPIKAIYTGNLLIGRDKSLLRVIKAAKNINSDGIKIRFDVYTNTELDESVKNELNCEYCEIHGPVSQEKVFELQQESDLMLFVEDIDGPDSRVARLSFSTKITDYLSSGKCIFAVGHKETAPMQYLINNNAALIADNDKEIEEKLQMLVDNTELLAQYAENAAVVANKNHNEEKILKTFDEVIRSVL